MNRDELRTKLLAEKAIPVYRALLTEDGLVLLGVLRDGVDELRASIRPAHGSPVDPYALAMAEGAQSLIDRLITFRDAAEKRRTEHG